jgi:uncharacterized delta-60 repeat protein
MNSFVEPLEPRRLFAIFALDPTFAGQGFVKDALNTGGFAVPIGYVDAVENGKVIAASAGSLARFNADGSLDTSYGPDGTGFAESNGLFRVGMGLRQSDAKVIVIGDPNGDRTGFVTRYNADGRLDTAYGTNGLATLPIGGDGTDADGPQLYLTGAALQSTGKLVIVGYTVSYDPNDETGTSGQWQGVIIRLNTDGSPDTSFGGDGLILTTLFDGRLPNGSEPAVGGVAIDAHDRIFIAGMNPTDLFLSRYTPSGVLDTTFSGDGVVPFEFDENEGSDPGKVAGVIIQSEDGKIVVGGEDGGAAVARFNTDGSLDNTFGDGVHQPGVAITPGGYYDGMDRVTRDAQGRYVGVSRSGPVVYRFLSDGKLDESIGAGGMGVLAASQQFNEYFDGATSVDVDDQGRVFFGTFDSRLVRADFRADLDLMDDGTLVVTGTSGDDTVSFASSGSNLVVTRNGTATDFPRADVQRIDVLTGAGDDTVSATVSLNGKIAVGGGTNAVHLADGGFTLTSGDFDGVSTPSDGNTFTAGDGDINIDGGVGGHSVNIDVGTGRHSLWGSDGGDDVITVAGGDTFVQGYGGNDTITTGAGNDSVQGDNDDDSISSGAGDDLVSAGDGDNVIDAGSGDDTCFADEPPEWLPESGGSNTIFGGDGDDALSGAGRADRLYGGAGRDTLVGNSGPDLLSGGGGKDKLAGMGGKDRLYGGANNDRLDGGNHQDRLSGGAGNDLVIGGAGRDVLHGDADDDTFVALDGESDTIDGGAGDNTVFDSDDAEEILNATRTPATP